ncbi:MAG: ice-binding family protein [Bacillota bacterium]|nr:ice-binding family protein [Bacillota bacterium]
MSSLAAQDTVELGTAKNFGVLAGSAITNTGPTWIEGTAGGDVGLSSATGAAITGLTTVNADGTIYTVDAAGPAGSVMNFSLLTTAKDDLITAYNDAVDRTPDETISADLAGETLTPGVYKSDSSIALAVGGTLTLDGQNNPNAVFIFQAGSTLTTGSGSKVVLINGAQPCRVFWQIGSSATLGTDSDFVGHIMALTSITANNGAEVKGQLLAINGAVTLENNDIINDVCTPPAPAISVEKYVSIDDGENWLDADGLAGLSIVAGSEVQFKFVVTNTGDVELTNINLNDSVFGDLSGDLAVLDPLASGASFEVIVDGIDVVVGQHSNTATATGDFDDGTYSDTDDAHYLGLEPDAPVTSSYIMKAKRQLPTTGGNGLLLAISVISVTLAGGLFLKGYRRKKGNYNIS